MSDECHFISVKNDTPERITIRAVVPPNVILLRNPVNPNEKIVNDLGDYKGSDQFRLIFLTERGAVAYPDTLFTYNQNIDVKANFTVTAGDDPIIVTFDGFGK